VFGGLRLYQPMEQWVQRDRDGDQHGDPGHQVLESHVDLER
jgi:hypothetical protein